MSLESDIKDMLNAHNAESASNTPDWILAEFLGGCLEAFNETTRERTEHLNAFVPDSKEPLDAT